MDACQIQVVGGARAVLSGVALMCLLNPYWNGADRSDASVLGRSLSGRLSLVGGSLALQMPVVHPADVTVDCLDRYSRSFLLVAVRVENPFFLV